MTVAVMDWAAPDKRFPNSLEQRPQTNSGACTKFLGERLADFAVALLDPERPMPSRLVGPDGRPDRKRFNVYRNNVVAGLTASLKDAYPVVARLVGNEFFAAMARIFVVSELPKTPVMFEYGAGFPDFINGFGPAGCLPYLPDVARIERGWVEAYYAAEATPLDPNVFGQIAPGDLPNIRLRLHPSLRLVRSRFPSLAIWQANIKDSMPAPVDLLAGGDDILILRPEAEVALRSVPPGGAEFLVALGDNLSVIEALKVATTADPRFDLAVNLSGLMDAKAFIEVEVDPDPFGLGATRRP